MNVYLIDDEPLTLVDAGPNSATSFDELTRGIAALGHSLEDVELVILTHQHIDHLGLVGLVASHSGVLPGHGDPITDHRSLIDERLEHHRRRADRLHRLIAERPRSAYELAQALRGNIAVTQAYLTLSEVLGHTDMLLNEGTVREVEDGGVVRFEAVAGA